MEKGMLKKILATICIIALILPICSQVIAATDTEETLNFGISKTNENGIGYKVTVNENGQNVERQVYRTYVSTNGSKDFSQGVFCLDSSKSFPGESTTLYKKIGDYTEKEEVQKIADNMYLPSMTQEEKDAILLKIFEEKMKDDVIPPVTLELIKKKLTADDIFFAEQCAIWKYTNNSEWSGAAIQYTRDGENWLQASDIENDDELKGKLELMQIIYDYFTAGNSKLSLAKDLTDVTLTKSNKETIELSDGVAVGPFKINSGTNTNYTAKLYDQTGKEITSYTLVDKSEKVLGNSLNNVLNKDFYVKVTDKTVTKVVLKIEASQIKTTKTLWKANANTDTYQPLLLVRKETVKTEDSDEAVVVLTDKIYDLALRKYITKVGDKEITNREPEISYDETTENKIVYKHKKDPILLNPGDKVVYTITVYNEGEEAGKPTKIVDYLPEGLEFVPSSESQINKEYGWIYNTDKNYAITEYTKTKQDLDPFDKEKMKISSISVQIECKVKETVTEGILTNIAEIAEDNVEDIDSVPYTIKREDYDFETYKGKDNKEDLTDSKYFYKGQEDDDDFEKVTVEKPEGPIDLALRKYIQTINGKNQNREPEVDVTSLKEGTATTAEYTHPKNPISVKQGDVVIYSIRLYNEGEEDAYANEVTDYLPEGLGFLVNHKINYENGWNLEDTTNIVKLNEIKNATSNLSLSDFQDVENLNSVDVAKGKVSIKSTKLKYTEGGNDNVIKAFNEDMEEPDYKTLQVACVVVADDLSKDVIKNIAAITEEKNSKGEDAKDRDSEAEEIDTSKYPDNDNIQDDDDFEKLILQPNYDLSLKKFITSVEGKEITPSRLKDVNTAPLQDGEEDAEYDMDKTIVKLKTGDTVVYTIRVYNEGDTDAYVGEIVDTVPEGLEFVENSEINKTYRWKTFEETDTEGWETGIKTDYLSEEVNPDKILKAFDKETGDISYQEVQIEFKVVGKEAVPIKNIAEITKDDGDDRDSTPNNKVDEEDDQDYDTVIPVVFDLALQKFITGLNGDLVTGREPMLSIDDDYNIKYAHTTEPMSVANGNIVTYTIRVYNEGNLAGYAAEVKDDIPNGLVFLPDDELNKEYGWKEVNGEIRTTYLSKEESEARGEDNLIKAFDRELGLTDKNPDYRDLKVNFKVDQTKLDSLDRVITNTAEITKDTDENGNEVDDQDSEPDNNKDGEDDIDKERVELKYFDLSLVKYTSTVIVNEDGKTKQIQTGHDGTENPEPAVKVEINRNKLNTTEVTFIFTIKVTNEGQLEGYATELKDRIPEGLSFYKEDNPDWEIAEDGIVVTNALAKTLLQPGESASVQIALRWNKSEKNLGMKTNIAEISQDDNPYGAPDIDSTPDNNKDGEDDQDDAPVLLSISTGKRAIHIVLIITIITMLGTGTYAIKKFVL